MILTVCLAVLGMLGVKAQQSIIALHHQGNVTIYSGLNVQKAMDASVNGDTLYLSNGIFQNVTITKPIILIGSGMDTFVKEINVAVPDSITLEKPLCQNINIYSFNINNKISGLNIRQCNITTINFNALATNSQFVSCFFGFFRMNYNIQGIEIVTSKIKEVNGQTNPEDITFKNCTIKYINNYQGGINGGVESRCIATYVNCIIAQWRDYTYWSWKTVTYFNCLLGLNSNDKIFTESEHTNCWTSKDFTVDENVDCSLSSEDLLTLGYVSVDGSVVGCNGTDVPFTLTPATPHILSHKIEVDNVNRTMTVRLKMTNDTTEE